MPLFPTQPYMKTYMNTPFVRYDFPGKILNIKPTQGGVRWRTMQPMSTSTWGHRAPTDQELRTLHGGNPGPGPARSVKLRPPSRIFGSSSATIRASSRAAACILHTAGGLGINEIEEGPSAVLAIGAAIGGDCRRAAVGPQRATAQHSPRLLVFIVGTLGCTFAPERLRCTLFRFARPGGRRRVGDRAGSNPSRFTRMRGALVALDQFMIVFGQLSPLMNAALSHAHGGLRVLVS